MFFSVHFQALRYKCYYKPITTRDSGNVQSHDLEESKLNSTINMVSGSHALADGKKKKSPFNMSNVATIKSK